jgi:hypothetical protein
VVECTPISDLPIKALCLRWTCLNHLFEAQSEAGGAVSVAAAAAAAAAVVVVVVVVVRECHTRRQWTVRTSENMS